jgi:hypothetical protein
VGDGSELRVDTTKGQFSIWTDAVYLSGYQGERLLDDDLVEFAAIARGTTTYTAVLGNQITIPLLDVARLQRAGSVETPLASLAPSVPQATATLPFATSTPGQSALGDRGIVFSQPVPLGSLSLMTVGLIAENTSDLVKSYTVKATYKSGDTITATATGFVNDHLPGTKRAVTLLLDGTPGGSDSVRVDVDTMVLEQATTAGAAIARQLTFGAMRFSSGVLPTIDVEVTNNASQTILLTVSAAITRNNDLVGIASGAVSDLAPGQTKTATLLIRGQGQMGDGLILAADAVMPK